MDSFEFPDFEIKLVPEPVKLSGDPRWFESLEHSGYMSPKDKVILFLWHRVKFGQSIVITRESKRVLIEDAVLEINIIQNVTIFKKVGDNGYLRVR